MTQFSWNKSAREQYEDVYRLIRTRDTYTRELKYNEELQGATEHAIKQGIASINDALARSYHADIAQAALHHFHERDRVTYNCLGVRQEHSENWGMTEMEVFSYRDARYDLLRRKAESEKVLRDANDGILAIGQRVVLLDDIQVGEEGDGEIDAGEYVIEEGSAGRVVERLRVGTYLVSFDEYTEDVDVLFTNQPGTCEVKPLLPFHILDLDVRTGQFSIRLKPRKAESESAS